MRHTTVLAAAVGTMLFGLACAGMQLPTGGGHANVAACTKYVETFNSVECNSVDLKVEDLCPAAIDQSACDLSEYYGCMANGVKCNNGVFDMSGQANCSMPSCK
ncbi:MAG: hypothetical protein ABMB14_11510 [Myxococcota bacterium]